MGEIHLLKTPKAQPEERAMRVPGISQVVDLDFGAVNLLGRPAVLVNTTGECCCLDGIMTLEQAKDAAKRLQEAISEMEG